MNYLKTLRTPSGLEVAIADIHEQMKLIAANSPEYDNLTNQLTKLYKLREHDARLPVKPDTLVLAATNLIGIAMIVRYEREHVITTKAVSFVKAVFK